MKDIFIDTMSFIHKNFGNEPFAKYRYVEGKYERMSKFNAAVFDALAVSVADTLIAKRGSKKNKKSISLENTKEFKALFQNNEFFNSVEGSVNDREKVITRIELAINVFNQ